MWKILQTETYGQTMVALTATNGKSSIGFSIDGRQAGALMRHFGVKAVEDLVGKAVDSSHQDDAPHAFKVLALEQQHREQGGAYSPPSPHQIREMIALFLSMGLEPDFSLIDGITVHEALLPYFSGTSARRGYLLPWLERRIAELSEGRASLSELPNPREFGLGGIKGQALYCRLRRKDLPDIYLSIGPYGRPVEFRRPDRA